MPFLILTSKYTILSRSEITPSKMAIPIFIEAEQLISNAKFEEALELIHNFEKNIDLSNEERTITLLLKGRIYNYQGLYSQALEIGQITYNKCKEFSNKIYEIESLLILSRCIFLGELEKAEEYISKTRTIIKSSSVNFKNLPLRTQADYHFAHSLIFYSKDDYTPALDLAERSLRLFEEADYKIDLSQVLRQIGRIYILKREIDLALDYSNKSLEISTTLKDDLGIAESVSVIASIYYGKRDFNKALYYCKQCLNQKKSSKKTILDNLGILGAIYRERGVLTRALKYYNKAISIAEEANYNNELLTNLLGMGSTYRMKGEHNKAIEIFKQTLEKSELFNNTIGIKASLFYLILANLDSDNSEEANHYFSRLESLVENTESQIFSDAYSIAKALLLKKKGRLRNFTEAEFLLLKITETVSITPRLYHLALVTLCELFIEELLMTNNIEVLSDIDPLIKKMYDFAESQRSFSWLAETKLLEAKLRLIYTNIDEAKVLMTEAQRIAEMHDLNSLAIKISSEHDNLLEQLNEWENLSKSNASISERVELASIQSVLQRLQGKQPINPPSLTKEEPILLLIMNKDGISHFNHPFIEDWKFGDLFSSFMTAFNLFSSEIFSKSIDRVKIGQNLILIHPIEPFLICYVIK
ncbi:MAG: tetratricopeptide repeat protein, partial [Candidatus Hermodarchaeota archaeon]